jgi:hypothetical protein
VPVIAIRSRDVAVMLSRERHHLLFCQQHSFASLRTSSTRTCVTGMRSQSTWVRSTWYRQERNQSQTYPERTKMRQHKVTQFVVCIKNDQYPASLEVRKIYRSLPDASAAKHQLIRVIDESGEDYLYPADYFVPIKLPQLVVKALALPTQVAAVAGRSPRRRSSLRAGCDSTTPEDT